MLTFTPFLPPTPSKGQGWSVLKISNSVFVKTKKFFEIVGKRMPMSLYECLNFRLWTEWELGNWEIRLKFVIH